MKSPSKLELDSVQACREALCHLTDADNRDTFSEREDIIHLLRSIQKRAAQKERRAKQRNLKLQH